MSSRFRTLYIGVTNDVQRRVAEHRKRIAGTFTAKYRIDRLVYVEEYKYVTDAITREKQLKGWIRAKKLALIEGQNPEWKDLGDPNEVRRRSFGA